MQKANQNGDEERKNPLFTSNRKQQIENRREEKWTKMRHNSWNGL